MKTHRASITCTGRNSVFAAFLVQRCLVFHKTAFYRTLVPSVCGECAMADERQSVPVTPAAVADVQEEEEKVAAPSASANLQCDAPMTPDAFALLLLACRDGNPDYPELLRQYALTHDAYIHALPSVQDAKELERAMVYTRRMTKAQVYSIDLCLHDITARRRERYAAKYGAPANGVALEATKVDTEGTSDPCLTSNHALGEGWQSLAPMQVRFPSKDDGWYSLPPMGVTAETLLPPAEEVLPSFGVGPDVASQQADVPISQQAAIGESAACCVCNAPYHGFIVTDADAATSARTAEKIDAFFVQQTSSKSTKQQQPIIDEVDYEDPLWE